MFFIDVRRTSAGTHKIDECEGLFALEKFYRHRGYLSYLGAFLTGLKRGEFG